MIEIKHKLLAGNAKVYRWTCTLCSRKGAWVADVQAALDAGEQHAKSVHS